MFVSKCNFHTDSFWDSKPLSRWKEKALFEAGLSDVGSSSDVGSPSDVRSLSDVGSPSDAYLATKPLKPWQRRMLAVGVAVLLAIGIWAVATKHGWADQSQAVSPSEIPQQVDQLDGARQR